MIFHISRHPQVLLCGADFVEVYTTTTDHVTTEAAVENRLQWFSGDSVCLACVKRARPCGPKQLRACTDIEAGTWVVLCGCGGVRPQMAKCGKSAPLPLDKPCTIEDREYRAGGPPIPNYGRRRT